MENNFAMTFNNFLSKFNLRNEQYEEMFNFYEQLNEEEIEDVESYIEFNESLENYDYEDFKKYLMETLGMDIDNTIDTVDNDIDDDFEDEDIDDFDDDFDDEDIEEINDEIEEEFEEEDIEEIDEDFEDEDIDEIVDDFEDEDIEEIVDDFEEEDIEEINDEIEEDFEDEDIEEIKDTKVDYIPKRVYTDSYKVPESDISTMLTIPTEYTSKKSINKDSLKNRTFKLFAKASAFIGKFRKKEIEPEVDYISKKTTDIKVDKQVKNENKFEEYIKCNNIDNQELNDYINFINYREDKDLIIKELSEFIENNEKVINEEILLNKLRGLFIMDKPEEKVISTKPIIKEEKIIPTKPIIKEEKEETNKLNEKYETLKNEIFKELNEYEKAFIEDMKAENLNPGDAEFDQMLNERTVNKTRIYKYLLNIEKITILNAYENLGEFEKEFVNDAAADNIGYKDSEYYQMLNERCVNKNMINNYYSILENSYNNQKLISDDYMKHINYEASINLDNKKVKDLKEIAKERNLTKYSKLNKTELIKALNELTAMKLQQTQKELSL